jgi:regulator of sigma E protease
MDGLFGKAAVATSPPYAGAIWLAKTLTLGSSLVAILADLGAQIFNLGFTAVAFIFVLTLIVFIHEYGHYKVARWCGVGVETFSIGFGREIIGWSDRRGTRWKICWIPLGGYVKFEGDANAASMPSTPELKVEGQRSATNFHGKPVWQRASVVVAGPVANFLLAITIFAAGYAMVGVSVNLPVIDSVVEGSAAEKAGLLKGDRIISINGEVVDSFGDIQRIIMPRAGEQVTITAQRASETLTLELTPQTREVDDGLGGKVKVGQIGIGAAAGERRYEPVGLSRAVQLGASETWQIIAGTGHYLMRMIGGRESANQLGGPIAIAQISGKAAALGFYELIHWAGIISVSIGLINLFPVPMLDGGHLVYYGIEALRGRPMGARAQEIGFRIGFALVLALMVFATFNDILRIARF